MFTADVVIAGGGPAGAAVALALARHGISPVVLESECSPRLKVGECLPPNINPLLDHFGLTERLRRRGNLASHGNQFVWGSEAVEARDFTFDEREGFAQSIRTQLTDLDTQIAQLSAEAKSKGGAVSDRALERIRAARKAADRSLSSIAGATADNWETVKTNTNRSVETLAEAVEGAMPK